jgi:hypothetical protein
LEKKSLTKQGEKIPARIAKKPKRTGKRPVAARKRRNSVYKVKNDFFIPITPEIRETILYLARNGKPKGMSTLVWVSDLAGKAGTDLWQTQTRIGAPITPEIVRKVLGMDTRKKAAGIKNRKQKPVMKPKKLALLGVDGSAYRFAQMAHPGIPVNSLVASIKTQAWPAENGRIRRTPITDREIHESLVKLEAMGLVKFRNGKLVGTAELN